MKQAPYNQGRKKQDPVVVTAAGQPGRFHWVSCLAFALPFLTAGLVYLLTAAAGLTWLHGGDDGGDLATAVSLDGVPHPTGYPLYLLSGKLFLFLAPDPARALTLTTALWGALAVGALGLAVYHCNLWLLDRSLTQAVSVSPLLLEITSLAGGWLAALSLAFGPLVWSQAVIIEIYSLNLLLLSCLLLALVLWWEKPGSERRFFLAALVAGLAVGHHRTAIFSLLAAAVFVFVIERDRDRQNRGYFTWKRLALAAVLFGLAAGLPSLTLLNRGGQNPASNWDNLNWASPSTFWQYISGGEYRDLLFAAPPLQDLGRIAATAGLLYQQFGPVGLALGWVGLAAAWVTRPHYRPLAWLVSLGLVGHMGFASVYAADNSQVYLLPFFTFWAVAAGFGLGWLVLAAITRWPRPRYSRALAGLAVLIGLAVAGVSLAANYSRLDLNMNRSAEAWAKAQLDSAPAGAVLVSRQDSATFAMWYVQYVQRYRPEIAVVESRLLDRPWYRSNLARLYPDLKLPDSGISLQAANPARTLVQLTAPLPQETGLP